MIVLQWIICFFIYAFLGWCCEVVYCSIPKKKFINRGFLVGPICPIYGYGALLVLIPLYQLKEYWYIVLVLGFIITSAIEYFTSWVMEKMFHLRWWDYSEHKFNIKGRVCLLNSSLFAILVMVMVYLIHPLIIKVIDLIPNIYIITTAVIFLAAMIGDTIYSFISVGKLNQLIEKYKDIKEDVDEHYEGEWHKYIYARLVKSFPKLQSIKNKEPFEKIKDFILEEKKIIKDKVEKIKEKINPKNEN